MSTSYPQLEQNVTKKDGSVVQQVRQFTGLVKGDDGRHKHPVEWTYTDWQDVPEIFEE